MGKVPKILVTFVSRCDFRFKRLSTSFSKDKLIMGLKSNCCDCSIKKNREILWFLAD